jgi:hypothetical protein
MVAERLGLFRVLGARAAVVEGRGGGWHCLKFRAFPALVDAPAGASKALR